jgi:hypothetical protein
MIMKLCDIFEQSASMVSMIDIGEDLGVDYQKKSSIPIEGTTRTSEKGAPGTLKAKITRLYGGNITCDKTEKLKRRQGATSHDKAQANWYQNKHCGGASKVNEIFSGTSSTNWESFGPYHVSKIHHDGKNLVIHAADDVENARAKHILRSKNIDITGIDGKKGFEVSFEYDGKLERDSNDPPSKDAVRIFSLAIGPLRDFISKEQADYVIWTGDSGSRQKLYLAMAKKFATEIPNGKTVQSGEDFMIYKDESSKHASGIDEEEIKEVYPGQSSGRLKNYIKKKYGGDISCRKVAMLLNDPDVNSFYKKRASWYKSLHCKGGKQIREDEPMSAPDAALTIWDIDDTLFKTAARVLVKSEDGSEKELTSAEFNNYQLGPGECFDFSQFDDAHLFHATSEPIDRIWSTALNTLEKIGKRPGSRMVIITARRDLDDKHKFIDTFRKHGMDMSKVHVFRAGNLNHGSSAANKQAIIRELLELGNYSETRMFDDHQDNLRSFLELKTEFPHITFKAFPVGHDGMVGNPVII